jgi:hypothetical protein
VICWFTLRDPEVLCDGEGCIEGLDPELPDAGEDSIDRICLDAFGLCKDSPFGDWLRTLDFNAPLDVTIAADDTVSLDGG